MRDDFCKLLNYLKILTALIVKADILCPLLSGYIASFKRNFVYCLLGDIALEERNFCKFLLGDIAL